MIWDYTGVYGVGNISGDAYLKTLTLDYDFFNNEYFELSVINDGKIELYQPSSQSVYQFEGSGYIQYLKTANTKDKTSVTSGKLRKERQNKVSNPRENTRG